MGPQPSIATAGAPQNLFAELQAPELLWAMDTFAELVESAGPLCHLRFGATEFQSCAAELRPYLLQPHHPNATNNTIEQLEAAIERVFSSHVARLHTAAFGQHMRRALGAFERLPYIDASHRLAAQTAQALTTDEQVKPFSGGAAAPALYAIFRAQVMQHFGLDGEGQPLS